jgi:hypothetical protein
MDREILVLLEDLFERTAAEVEANGFARASIKLGSLPVAAPMGCCDSQILAFYTDMTMRLQAEVHHATQEMFAGSGNWRSPVGINGPGARLRW